MKGIKWFQRFAITVLIGVNAFVFLSMRDVNLAENIAYTIGMIALTLLIISVFAMNKKLRKKKSMNDQI